MKAPTSGFNHRHLWIILILGWIARFAYVSYMPPEVRSADCYSWEVVAQTLANGQNPYQETTVLNWPPFWMQLIYMMARISQALNCHLMDVIRIFLVAVESLVIWMLFRLLRKIAPQANPFVPILLGISLNPAAILLTCQHVNFDVLVGLWVLLFVGQLAQYYRSHADVDWLAACLFLGLGILTKTVPLVLCPMLAGGFRRVTRQVKSIGLVLLFGPVTLGMSIIYVLAPANVTTNVLCYRSIASWFGISGLLHAAGAAGLVEVAQGLFYLLLTAMGALTAFLFWKRERVEARELVLCAALFLVAIPGLGPGYSPQYLFWFLALLVASYVLYPGIWRGVLLAFGTVAALTYIVEYGLLPSHGMFVLFLYKRYHPDPLPAAAGKALADRWTWWTSEWGQTLMRLPLFIMFLVLLVIGTRLLVRNLRAEPAAGEPAPKRQRAR